MFIYFCLLCLFPSMFLCIFSCWSVYLIHYCSLYMQMHILYLRVCRTFVLLGLFLEQKLRHTGHLLTQTWKDKKADFTFCLVSRQKLRKQSSRAFFDFCSSCSHAAESAFHGSGYHNIFIIFSFVFLLLENVKEFLAVSDAAGVRLKGLICFPL